MNEIHQETLSAFVDGEVVGPEQLAAALSEPDLRDTLLMLARLRAKLRQDDIRPSDGFYCHVRREIQGQEKAGKNRLNWVRRVAAAVILICGGLAAGHWLIPRPSPSPSIEKTPPTPNREVQFTEGTDWFPKQ